MDFLPEEFEEILNIFRGETEEIIQKLNNNLLQLENSPNNKDLIVYLFRDAHSLKGAARMIGFNNIQRLAHKAEDVLGLAKENKIVINREISDALYKAMDLLSDLIQESVKLKKEYYTDDIQKIIDYIDDLIEKYQGQSVEESKNITQNEQNKEITTNPKTQNQDFLKTTITINALLSEAYLLLKNMQGEEGSSYIETFCDVIKQIDEKFEETNFYEIKNEIKNIFAKVNFVIKSQSRISSAEGPQTYTAPKTAPSAGDPSPTGSAVSFPLFCSGDPFRRPGCCSGSGPQSSTSASTLEPFDDRPHIFCS